MRYWTLLTTLLVGQLKARGRFLSIKEKLPPLGVGVRTGRFRLSCRARRRRIGSLLRTPPSSPRSATLVQLPSPSNCPTLDQRREVHTEGTWPPLVCAHAGRTSDWFVPGSVASYEVWDKPGHPGSIWIEKDTGHLYFCGVQL